METLIEWRYARVRFECGAPPVLGASRAICTREGGPARRIKVTVSRVITGDGMDQFWARSRA